MSTGKIPEFIPSLPDAEVREHVVNPAVSNTLGNTALTTDNPLPDRQVGAESAYYSRYNAAELTYPVVDHSRLVGRALVESIRHEARMRHPAVRGIAETYDPDRKFDPDRTILKDSERFVRLVQIAEEKESVPLAYLEAVYASSIAYMKLGDQTLDEILQKFGAMDLPEDYPKQVQRLDDFDLCHFASTAGHGEGYDWQNRDVINLNQPVSLPPLAINLRDPNAYEIVGQNKSRILWLPRPGWAQQLEHWRTVLREAGIELGNGVLSDRSDDNNTQTAVTEKVGLTYFAVHCLEAANISEYDERLIISASEGTIADDMELILQMDRPDKSNVAAIRASQNMPSDELRSKQLELIPNVVSAALAANLDRHPEYYPKLGVIEYMVSNNIRRQREEGGSATITVLVDDTNIAANMDGPYVAGMHPGLFTDAGLPDLW